jgi:hypothetical protein
VFLSHFVPLALLWTLNTTGITIIIIERMFKLSKQELTQDGSTSLLYTDSNFAMSLTRKLVVFPVVLVVTYSGMLIAWGYNYFKQDNDLWVDCLSYTWTLQGIANGLSYYIVSRFYLLLCGRCMKSCVYNCSKNEEETKPQDYIYIYLLYLHTILCLLRL